MHAQNQEALSDNSCQRLPQSPPRACSARGRSRHIAPFGGGLLAGSAHVENGDNGGIGIGCWF
ncbi:hypothetical protein [Yersinia bercovieri]|uniref:hypothetical protein n=1 Tax=Yersinia bercovieri TaxID=634 RepID=UPI0030CE6FCF